MISEKQRLEVLALQNLHWGDLQRAERAAKEALKIAPEAITPSMILGDLAFRRHDDKAGIAIFRKILKRDRNNPIAHDWLAYGLGQLGKLEEALKHSNKAVSLAPELKELRVLRQLYLLRMGRWEEGFQEVWEIEADAKYPIPLWAGEPLAGRNLAVVCGAGLGDAINFIRYLKLIPKEGGKISVICKAMLIRLLRSMPEIDGFIPLALGDELSKLPEDTVLISAELLPHIFRTTPDGIPEDVPYLHAAPDLVEKWAPKFSGENRVRVGLVWSGGARKYPLFESIQNRKRNMPLTAMAPLFEVPGVAFYSLQTDIESGAARQANNLPSGILVDWTDDLLDLADTAALIANLDLVISVDTAVAHLAGAMGKPVWMLNRFSGDWRWGTKGERTPWYPSMRIFRQPKPGDWPPVIQKGKKELNILVREE